MMNMRSWKLLLGALVLALLVGGLGLTSRADEMRSSNPIDDSDG